MESITANGWQGFLGRGLAPRELRCVLGLVVGRTSKELAREMDVAPATVDKRILAATTKLGVGRRTALVAEALRRGIIAPACIAFLAILLLGQHQQSTLTRRPEGPRRIELRVAARRDACAWVA